MSLDDLGERSGAGEGTRTPDPIITNDVLYQLSYTGQHLADPAKGPRSAALIASSSGAV